VTASRPAPACICEGTVEAVHTHLAPALRFEADLRDGSGQLMLRLRFVGCERVPASWPVLECGSTASSFESKGSPSC